MSDDTFENKLNGRGVVTQDGREIGKLSDLGLDLEGWSVGTLLVKLDRDLLEQFQLKKPMFGTHTIELPVSFVTGIGDKVVLRKKLEELVEHATSDDAE